MRLVGYERQVVNGFNHLLHYKSKNGEEKSVLVYENIEGSFDILSVTGNK